MAKKNEVIKPAFEIKHMKWIVDAAFKDFSKSLKNAETELARHEYMLKSEKSKTYFNSFREDDRAHQIETLRYRIAEYRMICAKLEEMSNAVLEKSAQEFAEDLKQSGFFK